MEYRFLGRSGLQVSELCLGTMTFGREASEKESHEMLDAFVEAGGNFLDTANVYGQGRSEEVIGTWLKKQRRENFIVATKVRFPMGQRPNQAGLSRKHVLDSVAASLKRLGTDYIDLYQVHCWDPRTPLEETLSTLSDLVRAGMVRYVGASNFSGWQLQKAIDLSRSHGFEAFVSLQPQYNLLTRSTEWELIPVAQNEGLGVIAWNPLRGGWLSGRFKRGMQQPLPGSRIERAEKEGWSEAWSRYANQEQTWQILDTLHETAETLGKTPAQVAINWLLNKPGVTAPIIGARNLEQLSDNLSAVGWRLTSGLHKRLDAVSAPHLPYPYDFIEDASIRR